jgi:type VI secretion system protein ImpK
MVSDGQTPVPRELSTHWRGASFGQFRLLRAVPVWASASLLALILLAQFGWSKYQLLSASTDLEKRIHALRQLQPEQTQVKALGLSKLLSDDIAKGVVTVIEDPNRSQVVFKGDGMFAKGQTRLSTASLALVEKVGQAIQAVEGKVIVSGHTDNRPINDPGGINKALSLARAREVAKVLEAQGVPARRLDVQGKADQEPMVSNDTEAGRSQNRRVVIEVLSKAQ